MITRKVLSIVSLVACLAGSAVVIGAGAQSLLRANGSQVPERGGAATEFTVASQPNGTVVLVAEVSVAQGGSPVIINIPAGTSFDIDQVIISNGTWSSVSASAAGVVLGSFKLAVPATFGVQNLTVARPIRVVGGDSFSIYPSQGSASAFWDVTLVGRAAPALAGLTLN